MQINLLSYSACLLYICGPNSCSRYFRFFVKLCQDCLDWFEVNRQNKISLLLCILSCSSFWSRLLIFVRWGARHKRSLNNWIKCLRPYDFRQLFKVKMRILSQNLLTQLLHALKLSETQFVSLNIHFPDFCLRIFLRPDGREEIFSFLARSTSRRNFLRHYLFALPRFEFICFV